MFKKQSVILLFILISVSCIFSWQNTYTANSNEYKQLMNLCAIAGTTPANMVTPISSEQMLNMLESISYSNLPENAKKYYDNLIETLEYPCVNIKYSDLGFKPIFNLSVQGIKQATEEVDWLLQKRDRKPMAEIGSEVFFNYYLYGYFNWDILDIDNDATKSGKDNYKNYTTNLIKNTSIKHNIDFSSPHRAFVSLGYSKMNLIVGRDRTSLGGGYTGNMTLGDNLIYNDFVKASVLNGPVSYDFTVLSYENSEDKANYYDTPSIEEKVKYHKENPLDISNDPYYQEKHQLVFIHNFSYSPAKWLNITLTEGALCYGNSLISDLRKINPFFILHNIFDYSDGSGDNLGNMNNFFGLEIKATLPLGFRIDAQAVFDQIQLGGEREASDARGAQGFLLNISESAAVLGGLGSCYIEGVYTSPNLYLKQSQSAGGEYYNLDLIVGKRYFWSTSYRDNVSYLGYKYGPDTFALGTGCEWQNDKGLKLGIDAIYKMHGTQGILFYEGQNDTTITYGEDPEIISGENIESKFIINLSAKYDLTSYISFEGEIGFQTVNNYRNTTGKYNDIQGAIAITFSPIEIFNIEKTM